MFQRRRQRVDLLLAHIAHHQQLRRSLGQQAVAIGQHVFQRQRLQHFAAFAAFGIRHAGNHLHRLNGQFKRLALLGGVQLLQIPGLGLRQLIFRRREAGIAFDQRRQQLRQALGKAVGVKHQAVVRRGREAQPANRCLIAQLIQREAGQIIRQ